MFITPMKGIYVPSLNCFFFLIEKNANTSLRMWAILNFCKEQDTVLKTKKFLKDNDPQGFSSFFHELTQSTEGNISDDLKYGVISRENFMEHFNTNTKFIGFLRDPVERAISVYGDKLDRLIPESKQLALGGKSTSLARKSFIEALREYTAYMNMIRYFYEGADHINELKVVTKNNHISFYDRHIRQQYELVGPLGEMIFSNKAFPHMQNHLFLLDTKDSGCLDGILKAVTGFETKIKIEKIKARQSKEKFEFTKEEREEIKKILMSDYEFLERTNIFTYRKESES